MEHLINSHLEGEASNPPSQTQSSYESVPSNRSERRTAQREKKAISWPLIAAIGAGVILISNKMGDIKYDAPDNDAAIAGALTPKEIDNLLSDDNSPVAFTVPAGQQLTYEQRIAMLSDISDKYATKVDSIAASLATDAADIYGRLGLTLSGALPAGTSMTEKGLELYLMQLDNWAKVYGVTAQAVANEVTKIVLGAQSTDVTSCTATTFVKDITEESHEVQQTQTVVTVTAKAKNGFLGILGKKKSSSSQTMATSFTDRTESRQIAYIPHCTSYQIDPAKYEALMGTTVLGFKMQTASMKAIFAAAPDPFMFLTKNKS